MYFIELFDRCTVSSFAARSFVALPLCALHMLTSGQLLTQHPFAARERIAGDQGLPQRADQSDALGPVLGGIGVRCSQCIGHSHRPRWRGLSIYTPFGTIPVCWTPSNAVRPSPLAAGANIGLRRVLDVTGVLTFQRTRGLMRCYTRKRA